jgi:hypothetical protein
MSVAALEARALEESVAPGVDGVAARFYARARRIVDVPWLIATGEDLRHPQIEGPRPPGSGVMNRYFNRVHAIASRDPVVCRRFFDVLNMLAPPSAMLAPSIAWRVLTGTVPGDPGSPWGRSADAAVRVTASSS